MPTQHEIIQQQDLLQVHRQTLSHYVQQLAMLGKAYVPPGVIHGITEAQSNIRRVKSTLRDWDIKVEDHPDDELPVTQHEIGISVCAELELQYIVRLRPDDQATEPNYYVELFLYNRSSVIANHFRFICHCYTPINPEDPTGKPYPVNLIPNWHLPQPNMADMNNYATIFQALPINPPDNLYLTRAWEMRCSNVQIYPTDQLHIGTIEVFRNDLSVRWRLDSENGIKTGSMRCPRPVTK